MTHALTGRVLMTTSAISAAIALLSAASYAQDAESTQIETIVVTAQKHSELLSKAAVSVSAVTQSGIDKVGAISAKDLAATIPNLQTTVNGNYTEFAIRGIGDLAGKADSYSTVATQVDGIYQPNIAALANGMYDVQQVEVARGPQGTVFGRNATAGVVNINTADPTDEFGIKGDIAVGNYSDITARAAVNIPLTDGIWVRASAVREKNDGYYPKGAARDNYDMTDIFTTQLTALVKFTDRLTWRVAAEHAENTGSVNYLFAVAAFSYPNMNFTTGTLGTAVKVPVRSNMWAQDEQTENFISTQENALRSRLTWTPTDELTFTYLAGYSTFVNNGFENASHTFNMRDNGFMRRSMVHELDVNYETDRLKAVGGLYYYWENMTGAQGLNVGSSVASPLNSIVSIIFPTLNHPTGQESASYGLIDLLFAQKKDNAVSRAAFVQATYSVLPGLRVTGGVRYTADHRAFQQWQTVCGFGSFTIPTMAMTCSAPYGPATLTDQAVASDNVSWKATIDYDLTENQMVYGTVSTGYRGGGFSADGSLPANLLSYKPETVTNYELGWKAELLEKSMALNLTLFNMNYQDMQVSSLMLNSLNNPTVVTVNAAKSRVRGAEFEWLWRITPHDQVRGFATYLDPHFTSYPNGVDMGRSIDSIYNIAAGILGLGLVPANPPVVSLTGKSLPFAPAYTFQFGYSHIFDLGEHGTLTPDIQFYWQAKTYGDIVNSVNAKRDPYHKTDFNLTYETTSGVMNVNLFVHNLENAKVPQYGQIKWDSISYTYNPPRTYGIRVGFKVD